MKNSGLYTGHGDKGYTRTVKNIRISKADDLIGLIGTIDEYSASLGVAKANCKDNKLKDDLGRVQKKLVSIMGELAGGDVSVTEECVKTIEEMTDEYMPEQFTEFTLPGENIVSSYLDLARAVIRRGERIAAKVMQTGRIRPVTYIYLNRLSDMTYAMARYTQTQNKPSTENNFGAVSHKYDTLNLDLAKEIALAVEKRAEAMNKCVVVAILDAGANLMLLHSMEDAYIASCQIAQDKAYTAVSLKMPTHIALAESRGGTLDGLVPTDSNRLMLLGGGEPLIINNKVVGAIGVSGGTAEEDIAFAEFGAMYLERRLSL